MAGKVGFEPTTLALTVRCSAIELYAKKWSERRDLNPQSSAPKADAIAKLRYARIKLYIKSSELEYNLTISLKKLLKNYILYIYIVNWFLLPYKSSRAFQKINTLVYVTLLNPLRKCNLLNI